MNPQTALITGASSGIGRALAQRFAAHRYNLVLVARNEAALQGVARTLSLDAVASAKAAGPRGEADPSTSSGSSRAQSRDDKPRPTHVQTIVLDLAQPGSATALVEQISARGIQIDIVVNNAGFGLQGEFAALALERQLEMIQLNVATVTELTRLLLPGMLARGNGGVLNVASTAAFQPGPLMSVYYATKAYVLSFTEGIAEEVLGRGIKVSCVCPGPTETEFGQRAAMTTTKLFKAAVMDADDVAREAFDGWNAGKVVIVPGFNNRRGTFVVRLVPRALVRRIVKRLNSQQSP